MKTSLVDGLHRMWPHACAVQGNLMIGGGEDCPWCGAVESAPASADKPDGDETRERCPACGFYPETCENGAGCPDGAEAEASPSLGLREAAKRALDFYDSLERKHDPGEPEVLDALQRALAAQQPSPQTSVDRVGVLEEAAKIAEDEGHGLWRRRPDLAGTAKRIAAAIRALQPAASTKPQSEGER